VDKEKINFAVIKRLRYDDPEMQIDRYEVFADFKVTLFANSGGAWMPKCTNRISHIILHITLALTTAGKNLYQNQTKLRPRLAEDVC